MRKKRDLILVALILLGMVSAIWIVAGRVRTEQKATTYDIVLDYASMKDMLHQSDRSEDFWLDHFYSLGIRRAAVLGSTISSLNTDSHGAFLVRSVTAVRNEFRWEEKFPDEVAELVEDSPHSNDILITTEDADAFAWLLNALEARSEQMETRSLTGSDNINYLWISSVTNTEMDWWSLDLGVYPETAGRLAAHGFTVIPRAVPTEKLASSSYNDAVMAELDAYASPYFISGGSALPGGDDEKDLQKLSRFLTERNIAVGIVERSDQSLVLTWEGLSDLLDDSGYQAARVFSMWPYIQNSYAKFSYTGPEEITNSLYRAVYERGCRIVYLKMIFDTDSTTDYITDPEDYEILLNGLNSRLESRGWTQDVVRAAPYYDRGVIPRIVVGIGAVSAVVLLLALLFSLREKTKWGLLALGCAGVVGAMYVMPNTSKLLLSMGGGIVMPCLAAVWMNRYLEKRRPEWSGTDGLGRILLSGWASVLLAFVLSCCGALFASSALSDTKFMLETELYRGVKMMQLLPIFAAVASYLFLLIWRQRLRPRLPWTDADTPAERRSIRREKWSSLMDHSISLRDIFRFAVVVVILAALAAIGSYYIRRTGNASNGISVLELELRNFMEQTLIARPRTKEFLVGVPCVMLLIWSARRKLPVLPLIFEIGGVIGCTSVVNTFLHIRTPFLLSVIRVLTGLGFGLVIGSLAVLVAELLFRLIRSLVRKVHV